MCFVGMPGPESPLPNPKTPRNINYVFGLSRSEAQHWMDPRLYLGLWMVFLLLVFHFPAHLALRRWAASGSETASDQPQPVASPPTGPQRELARGCGE